MEDTLRVILDTNIVVAIEGDSNAHHVNHSKASSVYRMIHAAGGQVWIIENQRYDFARIQNETLWQRRQNQLGKYSFLEGLSLTEDFLASAGYSRSLDPRSNDGVDAALLLALERNAASWLVTEDRRLLAHATQLGLQERVMTLEDALGALKGHLPPH